MNGPKPDVDRPTERSMLDALHARYDNARYVQRGNGLRWVCAEQVRNDSGFFAARTADFMAMDMWPGTGNAIHGHEVKVSRADWLVELRKPEKAMPFLDVVDYWWVAVADAAIVKKDELPEGWGLLVLTPRGLRAKVKAVRRTDTPRTSLASHNASRTLPRGFTASFMRAAAKTSARRALLKGPLVKRLTDVNNWLHLSDDQLDLIGHVLATDTVPQWFLDMEEKFVAQESRTTVEGHTLTPGDRVDVDALVDSGVLPEDFRGKGEATGGNGVYTVGT